MSKEDALTVLSTWRLSVVLRIEHKTNTEDSRTEGVSHSSFNLQDAWVMGGDAVEVGCIAN